MKQALGWHLPREVQALVVITTALLLLMILRPLPPWNSPTIDQPDTQPAPVNLAEPPLNFAILSQRNLRQPPVDPPGPAPAAPVPETPLALRLIGTAVEADHSFAVFGLPDNRTLVREVGGNVEGYEVMDVKRGSARLRRGEREYEVRVPWFDRIAAETAKVGAP